MSIYIDIEKLDFVSYTKVPEKDLDTFDSGVLYAMHLIDAQPKIDAVLVTRCKKCQHSVITHQFDIADGNWHEQLFCKIHGEYVSGGWFCADGKKRK